MKQILLTFMAFLALGWVTGCTATANTPPAALAPGYTSQADQTLGQSLAALDAFVLQEKTNYAQLSAAQQSLERPYLNTLIDAANVADAAYLAFHNNTGTLATAQANLTTELTAQANLTAKKAAH